MLIKGLLLTAAFVSTPLCFAVEQDPQPQEPQPARQSRPQEPGGTGAATSRAVQRELQAAQRDLDRAQRHVEKLERQLDEALDRLEATFEPQQHRNCSPSRSQSRQLMSHYQWLRKNELQPRAEATLATIVDRIGDDLNRLNGAAWDLMTDKETVGKYDEVALAIAERMEQQRDRLDHRQLDTVALARFLNGDVDRAVALQQQAIVKGGNSDDFRRRLRTYQAAQVALAKAQAGKMPASVPATAAVAAHDDD